MDALFRKKVTMLQKYTPTKSFWKRSRPIMSTRFCANPEAHKAVYISAQHPPHCFHWVAVERRYPLVRGKGHAFKRRVTINSTTDPVHQSCVLPPSCPQHSPSHANHIGAAYFSLPTGGREVLPKLNWQRRMSWIRFCFLTRVSECVEPSNCRAKVRNHRLFAVLNRAVHWTLPRPFVQLLIPDDTCFSHIRGLKCWRPRKRLPPTLPRQNPELWQPSVASTSYHQTKAGQPPQYTQRCHIAGPLQLRTKTDGPSCRGLFPYRVCISRASQLNSPCSSWWWTPGWLKDQPSCRGCCPFTWHSPVDETYKIYKTNKDPHGLIVQRPNRTAGTVPSVSPFTNLFYAE